MSKYVYEIPPNTPFEYKGREYQKTGETCIVWRTSVCYECVNAESHFWLCGNVVVNLI